MAFDARSDANEVVANIIRFFAILIENDTEGGGLVFVKSSTKLANIYKNIKRLAAKLPKLSKAH